MKVKDLMIGSPVYRVNLDSIDVARVRLIEQFSDGTRSFFMPMRSNVMLFPNHQHPKKSNYERKNIQARTERCNA